MKTAVPSKTIDRAFCALVIFSLLINLWGINWGLPSFNGWAADELTPIRVLEAVEQGFANGWHYKYPPFHFYLLTLFYSPVLLLHQLGVVNVYSLPTYTLLFYIGRVLSLIMAAGILGIVYKIGQELYDQQSAFFATVITSLNLPFIYYAKTINLDIPYLFWFMLSLLFYIRLLKKQQTRDYLLFAATAAIAVATKDQAYAFYILTPSFIVWQHYQYLQQRDSSVTLKNALKDRKIVLSLGVGLALFLAIHNVVFNLNGFFAHVNDITSGGATISPRFERNIFGHLTMFWQSLRHIRVSFGWFLYGICILGLLKAVWQRKHYYLLCLLIPIVSYYLFFVSIVMYNALRFLLPVCLILAFFGGKLIGDFLKSYSQLFRVKALSIIVVFIYTFFYATSVNVLMTHDSRYSVEQWMIKTITPNDFILGAGDAKYLPRLEKFSSESLKRPTLETLKQKNPDYIIGTSAYDSRRFEAGTPKYEFFSKLETEELDYDLVFQYKADPQWDLLNHQELGYRHINHMYVYSNFDKINPEIKIYKKSSQ
ncbi:ArnT family glycosyltransferase [Coleofasciculus sp. E2-BRE-01]|uniref:ArnT family glycosyltransferase n=1 Tax=Coleofasciculus sp. E2-BRE-01 TaxID=3069524 RepID=UPI0032FB300A